MRTYYEILSEARRALHENAPYEPSEEQVILAANGMYLAERIASAIVKAAGDSVTTVMEGRQGYSGLRELITALCKKHK